MLERRARSLARRVPRKSWYVVPRFVTSARGDTSCNSEKEFAGLIPWDRQSANFLPHIVAPVRVLPTAWHGTLSEMGMVVISGTIAVGPIGQALSAEGKPVGEGRPGA